MTDETLAAPETVAPQVAVSETETKLPEQQTGAETPAESSVPQPEDETGTQEKPKVKFSERFNQVYAEKKQLEAKTVMDQREIAQLREELSKLRTAQASDKTPYEQQDELRVRAAVKEERLAEKEAEAQYRQQETADKRSEAFRAKVEEAKERMPDFDQVFYQVPVSDFAADLIVDSSKSAEIAYWLGKNPNDARRIYGLPPHLQGAEIARIEARVSVAPSVRKTSKAPPPVSTIGGQSSPGAKDPGAMTEAEYSAWYAQRQARRS